MNAPLQLLKSIIAQLHEILFRDHLQVSRVVKHWDDLKKQAHPQGMGSNLGLLLVEKNVLLKAYEDLLAIHELDELVVL